MSVDEMYAYAVSRTRVLETRLIDRSKFARMLDSGSPEEALKILSETEYAAALDEAGTHHDFERVIETELRRVFDLILSFAPEPDLLGVSLLKYDFHNMKAFLKLKHQGLRDGRLSVGLGMVSDRLLEEQIYEGSYAALPAGYADALCSAEEWFEREGNPQSIDISLDRSYYGLLLNMTSHKRHIRLREFFKAEIDLHNIRSFLRVKQSRRKRESFDEAFIEGGDLSRALFDNAFIEGTGFLASKVLFTSYGERIADGIRSVESEGCLRDYERAEENYRISLILGLRLVPFGVEPLFSYLSAKEYEARNIRIIMVGKANSLPSDMIRERLAVGYA